MKRIGKCLVAAILSIAMVFGLVPMFSGEAEAATKVFLSYSDFPVNAMGTNNAFNANVCVASGVNLSSLQGWLAIKDATALGYYWTYTYNGKTYKGNLKWMSRNDVKTVYGGYSSYSGYRLNDNSSISFSSVPAGRSVNLEIYATISPLGAVGRFTENIKIGTYKITVITKNNAVVYNARQEYNAWRAASAEVQAAMKTKYFTTTCGYDMPGEAWCAAFASYCVKTAGLSSYIDGGNVGCCELLSACARTGNGSSYIANADGKEDEIYKKVKPGDLVFFIGGQNIPGVTHHVGIVTQVRKANGKVSIDYIDGNNGAGAIGEVSGYKIDSKKTINGTAYKNIIGFGLLHN